MPTDNRTKNRALQNLETVPQRRAALEQRERELVTVALEHGATWAEIAAALGVSRQAAHEKHAKRCS